MNDGKTTETPLWMDRFYGIFNQWYSALVQLDRAFPTKCPKTRQLISTAKLDISNPRLQIAFYTGFESSTTTIPVVLSIYNHYL